MKKAIVIIVIVLAGAFFYHLFSQHQANGRAAAAERARVEADRAHAKAEELARQRAEEERRAREKAEREEQKKAAEAKHRAEEERLLRLAREKTAREAAEREAAREKEKTHLKFVADNIAFFTEANLVFAANARKADRLGGVPIRTTYRLVASVDENNPRFYSLTLANGKLVEGVSLHADGAKTPVSGAELKALMKSSPWALRREGGDATVLHSPTGGRGTVSAEGDVLNVGKADLGGLVSLLSARDDEKLSYRLWVQLKPYGKLDLGEVGWCEDLSSEQLAEKIRRAIRARMISDEKKKDGKMKIVFTDGVNLVKHGSRIEVPRRFLRDNLKDIRAGRSGRKTDWALIRETRRQQRREWLDYYEEADRRERGIDKPREITVPEGDVSRALRNGIFSYGGKSER